MPPIRDWRVIREEMLQDMVGYLSPEVTFIDERSNIVGLVNTVAKAIQRKEYEIDRARRAIDIFTAEGSQLDALGQKRGVYRYGPSKAGAVVGVWGTGTLEIGDIVQSTSGVRFIVVSESATLSGAVQKNISLMSQCQIVAETGGRSGNVPAFTINRVVSGDATLHVLNVMPAAGGEDREGDAPYRERIIRSYSVLNNRTWDKYLAVCQETNEDVLRVWLGVTNDVYGVLVKVASRSLTSLSGGELSALETALAPVVYPDRPVCVAQDYSSFKVLVTVNLAPTYTLQAVHTNLSSNLANYVNVADWKYGDPVRDETLFSICANTTGIYNMDRSGFEIQDGSGTTITGDVPVGAAQLPKLVEVIVTDYATATSYGSGITLTQAYIERPGTTRPTAL